jgi:hypothetical protein
MMLRKRRAGDYERDGESGLLLPRRELRAHPQFMCGPAFFRGAAGPAYSEDTFATDTTASYTQYADVPGTWSVSAGFMNGPASATQSLFVRTGFTQADTKVECLMYSSNDGGMVVRAADTSNNYLLVVHDASTAGTPNAMFIYKRVAGAYTQLGTTATISFTRNTLHTVSLRVSGSTLTAAFDGADLITTTDSALATGFVGMRSNGSAAVFDAFRWNFI